MAERKSDDDFNPRHRIVGAVILVALAVIFLPLLLQDRPLEQDASGSRDVPETDTRATVPPGSSSRPVPDVVARPVTSALPVARPTTRTVTVPLVPMDDASPSARKPAMEATPSEKVAKVETAPVKTEPRIEPKADTKKEPKPAAKPKPVVGDWFVQVGVFSQPDNARRLQDKLKAQKYTVVTDPPRIVQGQTIKVEVGPYPDQSAARVAAARIKTDFGISGVVRKH